MAVKTQDMEFRHLEAVALMQGLTDEEEAKHSLSVREDGGVGMLQRREGGVGFHPWDHAPGLDGKSVASGAESLYADAVSSDSCKAASRKLRNLAGADISRRRFSTAA